MWRPLPLNAKLVSALLVVQATVVGAGMWWLTRWLESTRLGELAEMLDKQADAVEGLLSVVGGEPVVDRDGDVARELAGEQDVYFELATGDGRKIAASSGPPEAMRAQLEAALTKMPVGNDVTHMLTLADSHWLAQSERVLRHGGNSSLPVIARVALRADAMLSDTGRIRRFLALAALGMLAMSSLGTAVVVSFTTSNLVRFASHLRRIVPPRFDGAITLAPHSREEALLFESYRALLSAVREAIESQRLFIARASHELKTPIAAALAALDVTLMQPRTAGDYAQTCRDVHGEMLTLKRLSAALLDLAQLEESLPLASLGSSALEEAARRVVGRWRRNADARGIVLELATSPNAEDLAVVGTLEEWEVVLGNLVDNAIKYGRSNGRVQVKVRVVDERRAEVSIEDNGIGMGASDVARLGEVFFRAERARSTAGSFGLGFAHAQRIIQRLGGSVEVRSELGRGTEISVMARRAGGPSAP